MQSGSVEPEVGLTAQITAQQRDAGGQAAVAACDANRLFEGRPLAAAHAEKNMPRDGSSAVPSSARASILRSTQLLDAYVSRLDASTGLPHHSIHATPPRAHRPAPPLGPTAPSCASAGTRPSPECRDSACQTDAAALGAPLPLDNDPVMRQVLAEASTKLQAFRSECATATSHLRVCKQKLEQSQQEASALRAERDALKARLAADRAASAAPAVQQARAPADVAWKLVAEYKRHVETLSLELAQLDEFASQEHRNALLCIDELQGVVEAKDADVREQEMQIESLRRNVAALEHELCSLRLRQDRPGVDQPALPAAASGRDSPAAGRSAAGPDWGQSTSSAGDGDVTADVARLSTDGSPGHRDSGGSGAAMPFAPEGLDPSGAVDLDALDNGRLRLETPFDLAALGA